MQFTAVVLGLVAVAAAAPLPQGVLSTLLDPYNPYNPVNAFNPLSLLNPLYPTSPVNPLNALINPYNPANPITGGLSAGLEAAAEADDKH